MVGVFQKVLEQVQGFLRLSTEQERSDEPEGEHGEGSTIYRQSILGLVTAYKAPPRRSYQQPGIYPLPCCINSRCEASGARAHYQKKVLSLGLYTQLLGQLRIGRLHEDGAVVKDDGGDDLLTVVDLLNGPYAFRVLFYIDPLAVDTLLAQELLCPLAVGALGSAIDFYGGGRARSYTSVQC